MDPPGVPVGLRIMDSIGALLEAIQNHQLLDPVHGEELIRTLSRRFTRPHDLGQHLVKLGWLTSYQLEHLLADNVKGLVLGPYLLLQPLGEGGMGQVFAARHRRLHRLVALKVIGQEQLSDPSAIRRFHREALAAAQLAHPNIVTLYDADQVGDSHFLALEYVEGITLGELVKSNGPLPVTDACEYIRQAALGLQHAHERGIIHRDIKPGNLLLASGTTDPTVARSPGGPLRKGLTSPKPGQPPAGRQPGPPLLKILDMGLVRLRPSRGSPQASQLTQVGTVVGTPDFMAPEQAKDSQAADSRADLYSLGCTFYYLLTGEIPFTGSSTMEKLLKHQMDEPTPLDRFRSDVPPEVVAIVSRLMAKQPQDRYPSALEVAAALEPHARGETASHRSPATGTGPTAARRLAQILLLSPSRRSTQGVSSSSATLPRIVPFPTSSESAAGKRRTTSGKPRSHVWLRSTLLLVVLIGFLWIVSANRRGNPPADEPQTPTPERAAPEQGSLPAANSQAAGSEIERWTRLFNGKNLDGWDVRLQRPATPITLVAHQPEPPLVFRPMQDEGLPSLLVSGELPGTLTTQAEYENFHLRVDFKWGQKRPGSPELVRRHSGLLYHCSGSPDPGATEWPQALECRIVEGDCGSLGMRGDASLSVLVEGQLVPVRQEDRLVPIVQYRKRSQKFVVPLLVPPRVLHQANHENPIGEWNRIEVLTVGGTCVHLVNGRVAMVATDAQRWSGLKAEPLRKGRIQLESGGAEVHFRNLVVRPIEQIPGEYLVP